MSERVPVLVLVDEGYFGHEALQGELGPTFDVRFVSSPLETHSAMVEVTWPVVLAPRTLDPIPGDAMLADLERHRYDFVGALILDEETDRIGPGVHQIIRRPMKPGMLRLHVEAAAAMRARAMAEQAKAARLADDLTRLRDGLRHDLRGQLQSVVGLASLVLELEKPRRAPDDELIDFITRIAASGDRLTRFVDALGDWLNASRRPFEATVVDLGELVEEVVAKARATPVATSGKDSRVDYAIDPPQPSALGANVTGDARFLLRALETLIERAGTMSGKVRVRVAKAENGWAIGVSDVCPKPIPPAQSVKAFKLFERVAGGDGIGLALVHKIAERHGASAVLEPRPEGGHEVVLTLPWLAP